MANTTDGRRIYVIGDIHGCLDKLLQVQDNIRRDLHHRPHPHPVTIYIGDFTDRGPDSKGVIDNLLTEQTKPHQTHFLLGNHDQFFLNYFDDPDGTYGTPLHWLNERLGGNTTLASYGIDGADENQPNNTHQHFLESIPASHRNFLESLELSVKIGDYFFAHAGIRPNVALDRQVKDDLIWIREPFLSSTADHGCIIVHGHTPLSEVENHGNRIGIDTGAVFGRQLSCLLLENSDQGLLTRDGIIPCPPNR